MSDGQVVIDLTADDTEYQRALKSIQDSTVKQMDVISRGLIASGKAMTVALTAPIIASGAYSVKAAMDAETSFANVRKTVDATEAEYEQLKQSAREMSEVKTVSANQINELVGLGGQLGILNDKLIDVAGTAADLDIATDMNAEEAMTQIAQYSNITQMAQGDTERFGATIVGLGNNMATTESNIMAFAMRIGGAGAQVGMTNAQILGISASLGSVGIEAEAGGTAISTIISQVDRDVATNSDTLQVWAETAKMSVSDFAELWKTDAAGALQAIFSGMNDAAASGQNLNLVLDSLGISSLRQTDVMKRLSNASNMMTSSFVIAEDSWKDGTALADEAGKKYMTTEAQLTIFRNKMENTAATMGGPMLAGLNAIIDGAQPFLDVLRAGAEGFAEMDEGQRNTVVGMALLIAGAGPTLMIMGKLVGMGKSVSQGMLDWAAASRAQATAQAASTTTINIDTAAKTVNTTATKASTTATAGLEVATKKLRLAMASNPVGLVLVGITLLIPAAMALSNAFSDLKRGSGSLTIASKEQAQAIAELQREYEDAIAVHGELSHEANAARYALDQERAAFESSKQTLADFAKQCDKVVEAHDQMLESVSETVGNADAEAGAIGALVTQMDSLIASGDTTTESHAKMQVIMDSLSGSVAGLDGVYNSLNGTFAMSTEAIKALAAAEQDRLRYQGRVEAMAQIYQEQAAIEAQLALAKDEQAAAQSRLNAAMDQADAAALNNEYAYMDGALSALADEAGTADQAVANLSGAFAENESRLAALTREQTEFYSKQLALEGATSELASGVADADEIYARYGVTVEEVTAYQDKLAAEQEQEGVAAQVALTQAVKDGISAIDDYSSAHSWFASAMDASGVTSEGLATRLADLGMDFDDLADKIMSGSEVIRSSFEGIDYSAKASLDQMRANLEASTGSLTTFADDFSTLSAIAGSDAGTQAQRDFLASLGEMDPSEAAGIARQLVESLDTDPEMFSGLAESWATNIQAQTEAAIESLDVSGYKTVGADAGTALTEGTGEAITEGTEQVTTATTDAVTAATTAAVPIASNGGYDIGAALDAGAARGVRDNAALVASAYANVISNAIAAGKRAGEIRSPSGKTRREIGRMMTLGAALGVTDEQDALEAAMTSVILASISAGSSASRRPWSSGMDLGSVRFQPDSLAGGANIVTGGSVTTNYYSVGSVDVTGDAAGEQAMDGLFDYLRRIGRM